MLTRQSLYPVPPKSLNEKNSNLFSISNNNLKYHYFKSSKLIIKKNCSPDRAFILLLSKSRDEELPPSYSSMAAKSCCCCCCRGSHRSPMQMSVVMSYCRPCNNTTKKYFIDTVIYSKASLFSSCRSKYNKKILYR